jgi:hypothetical protein
MTAILAQVRGNSVGASRNRRKRYSHHIRPIATARVSDGGDVIDIDSETYG